MGNVDAICKNCGGQFQWAAVTPMLCPKCATDMAEQEKKKRDLVGWLKRFFNFSPSASS